MIIHEKTGKWTYPFMRSFNFLTFIIFAIACTGISGVFYYIGIIVYYCRWGGMINAPNKINNYDFITTDSSQYSPVDKKKQ